MANISKWIPFRRHNQSNVPARRGEYPLGRMQQQVDRMFDDFWNRPMAGFESFWGDYSPAQFMPSIDVSDEGNSFKVTAELPGMDADDVELSIRENNLHIQGEKKVEKETEEEGFYRTERSYGFFERNVPLPSDVIEDECRADFKKGVLTVHLPKAAEPKSNGKRISVAKG